MAYNKMTEFGRMFKYLAEFLNILQFIFKVILVVENGKNR